MQSETQSQHSRREQSRRISDFGDRLRTNGFDFQVLGVDLRGSVACEIMLAPQAFQLRGQLLLSALIEAREGHFRGPKILTEMFDDFLRRKRILEAGYPTLCPEFGN